MRMRQHVPSLDKAYGEGQAIDFIVVTDKPWGRDDIQLFWHALRHKNPLSDTEINRAVHALQDKLRGPVVAELRPGLQWLFAQAVGLAAERHARWLAYLETLR